MIDLIGPNSEDIKMDDERKKLLEYVDNLKSLPENSNSQFLINLSDFQKLTYYLLSFKRLSDEELIRLSDPLEQIKYYSTQKSGKEITYESLLMILASYILRFCDPAFY